MVPIFKGKGEKNVCGNYREISLMSMVGKVYGRILDERVKSLTKDLMEEEQGGFREGRGVLIKCLRWERNVEKKERFVCLFC